MRTGQLHKLSARQVKSGGQGMHSDGGGLYLRVKGTRRSWVFRFTAAGRKREMGLGPTASVSLARARERAAQARSIVAAGDDPVVEKAAHAARTPEAAPKLMTFAEAMRLFLPQHVRMLSNSKARAQWSSTLERYAAPLMSLRCSEITAANVADCLSPIWLSKTETASRTRQRIEAVLAFADAREDRDRQNPAALKGKLRFLLPKQAKVKRVQHHPAVPVADAPAAFAALAAKQDAGIGYCALLAVILTALRSGEIRHLEWTNIDREARLIRIPAERMKARREHVVPLTPKLEAHLAARQIWADSKLVFPSQNGRTMSDMTIAQAMRRTGLGAYTPHGWRSTFRDWSAQRGWARELAEHQLSHLVGSAVERAYHRDVLLEQRRPMMDAWERYVTSGIDALPAAAE